MKRSKKFSRVSWPPDAILCQVRLFLSEDCPSQVGLVAQDQLQAKTSWILHSNGLESDDLPPGFGNRFYVNPLKEKLSSIPLIEWQRPRKFALSCNWHVAAGEESNEAEAQKQREMRVLEAIYPRTSSIPPSPSVSFDIEDYYCNDNITPIIPIIPIEDEETEDPQIQESVASEPPSTSQCKTSPVNPPTHEKPAATRPPGAEADIAAAASAALTAIMKSNEQGSLIDTNLLIKILSNPESVEKLIDSYATNSNPGTSSSSMLASQPVTLSFPMTKPMPVPKPPVSFSIPFSRPDPDTILRAPSHTSKTLITSTFSGPNPFTPSIPSAKPDPEAISRLLSHSITTSTFSGFKSRPDPLAQTHMDLRPPARGSDPLALSPLSSPERDMYSLTNRVGTSLPASKAPVVKNLDYYKSLVQQHGGEKRENQDRSLFTSQYGNQRDYYQDSRDSKVKIQKPCMYFNSSKGCRNGSSCPFQHEGENELIVGSRLEGQAKRMKMDREIAGNT